MNRETVDAQVYALAYAHLEIVSKRRIDKKYNFVFS